MQQDMYTLFPETEKFHYVHPRCFIFRKNTTTCITKHWSRTRVTLCVWFVSGFDFRFSILGQCLESSDYKRGLAKCPFNLTVSFHAARKYWYFHLGSSMSCPLNWYCQHCNKKCYKMWETIRRQYYFRILCSSLFISTGYFSAGYFFAHSYCFIL